METINESEEFTITELDVLVEEAVDWYLTNENLTVSAQMRLMMEKAFKAGYVYRKLENTHFQDCTVILSWLGE